MFLIRRAPLRAIPKIAALQQRRALGSVSAIDSAIFRTLFGTEEIRNVFDDKAYLNRCVDAETALARAQSRCNVIPSHIGEIVTSRCEGAELDFDRLRRETEIVGYPILPLVRQLSALCGEEAGRYVHWGATTQDIMDLASILQMQKGLEIIEKTHKTSGNFVKKTPRHSHAWSHPLAACIAHHLRPQDRNMAIRLPKTP
jgi:3-carboxy-cis,cis-muconate cycloisomerase